MNKVLLLVSFLASSSAFASSGPSLHCVDNNLQGEQGYLAAISSDAKSAVISEESLAGPRVIANLECQKPNQPEAGSGNTPYTALVCAEAVGGDTGFSLVIREGGFTGLITATLEKESLHGPSAIAQMSCHSQK